MTTPKNTPRRKREDDEEVKASEVVEVVTPPLITLAEYVARAKPRAGLVASFTYEAKRSEKGLKDRSEDEWKTDFEAQATRIYPSF